MGLFRRVAAVGNWHGRRACASAGILAAVVAVTAVQAASALAASATSHDSNVASGTTISLLHRHVPAAGLYKVVVRLRGSGSQKVAVYANSGAHRRVKLDASGHARVVMRIRLSGTKLTLRIVCAGGRVHVKVSTAPAAASVVAPVAPKPAAPAPVTTPAAAPAPVTPATPAAVSQPEYLGPYTHLVWSDSFQGAAGAAPDSSKWTEQGNTMSRARRQDRPGRHHNMAAMAATSMVTFSPAWLRHRPFLAGPLISSPSTSWRVGPGRLELPARWSTGRPVMSAGMRSGVNWTRANRRSVVWATSGR